MQKVNLLVVAVTCLAVYAIASVSMRLSETPRRFWPLDTLPQLRMFDAGSIAGMRQELGDVMQREALWLGWPEYNVEETGNSNIIPMYAFDTWLETAHLFPQTSALLKTLPGLRTALFSRLGPETRLAPHTGYAFLANYVLRCHIVLQCAGECYVEVQGMRQHVERNDIVIFDNSLEHSAGNESSDVEYIVLILDIKRPGDVPVGTASTDETVELGLDLMSHHHPGTKLRAHEPRTHKSSLYSDAPPRHRR